MGAITKLHLFILLHICINFPHHKTSHLFLSILLCGTGTNNQFELELTTIQIFLLAALLLS